MAFHGDLSSYPLPDLLQWLDASKKSGALSLSWEADQRKVFLLSGQIIAASAPGLWERLSRVVEQTGEARGDVVLGALTRAQSLGVAIDGAIRQIAEEELVGGWSISFRRRGAFTGPKTPTAARTSGCRSSSRCATCSSRPCVAWTR